MLERIIKEGAFLIWFGLMKLCFWITGTKNRKHSFLAKPQETCCQESKAVDEIFWADILKDLYPWNSDHVFLMFLYLLSIFTITHHLLIISCGSQGIRLPHLHFHLTQREQQTVSISTGFVDFWSTNYNIFINLDALEEKGIQPIYGV